MGRAFCTVTSITLPSSYTNDNGEVVTTEIDSVHVECVKCRNSVDIYGVSQASELAGMATLRETCPRGEQNYYMKRKSRAVQ